MATGYLPVATTHKGFEEDAYSLVPVSYNSTGGLTPGANNTYSAATGKIKLTTETTLSATNAQFVVIQAEVETKKTLTVKVGPKGELVTLPTLENPGAATALITYTVIVPAGQYVEITGAKATTEPTYSALSL